METTILGHTGFRVFFFQWVHLGHNNGESNGRENGQIKWKRGLLYRDHIGSMYPSGIYLGPKPIVREPLWASSIYFNYACYVPRRWGSLKSVLEYFWIPVGVPLFWETTISVQGTVCFRASVWTLDRVSTD